MLLIYLGREHLKTEKLSYMSNGQSPLANKKPAINFDQVRLAKKSERIGAQQLSLKMILKEKINQKRKEEWTKREEQKKLDNEEEDNENNGSDEQEEEEEDILDDDEISEEDSEEEEDEEIDWEDEEAKLRAIDRKNRRKRIKQGSFLDDEAEDDDFDDEKDEEDDDKYEGDNDKLIINNLNAQEGREVQMNVYNNEDMTNKERNDLNDVVSKAMAQSISLPDTEELLADTLLSKYTDTDSQIITEKVCSSGDHVDSLNVKGDEESSHALSSILPTAYMEIYPSSCLKANQNTTSHYENNKIPIIVAESTPCFKAKEETKSGQNLDCWTPLDEGENSLSVFDKSNTTLNGGITARKKLGFETLFDTTDPQVDNMDDVIGLCSGQFLTQVKTSSLMPRENIQELSHVNDGTQNSQSIMCDTPDTVILTDNLTAVNDLECNNSTSSTNDISQKMAADSLDVSEQNENILDEEVQPGFMQDNCGVLSLLSSSDDECQIGRNRYLLWYMPRLD